MGRIVVTEFVSLDGVMEDPGGAEGFKHGGWTFKIDRGEAGDKFKVDELTRAEAQLLGRVTYEGFAAAWPSMEGPFADKFNSMPKYVVSNTLARIPLGGTTRPYLRAICLRGSRAAEGATPGRHPQSRVAPS